jgi:hypothetical protein
MGYVFGRLAKTKKVRRGDLREIRNGTLLVVETQGVHGNLYPTFFSNSLPSMRKRPAPPVGTAQCLGAGDRCSAHAFPLRTLRQAFLSIPVPSSSDTGLAPEGRRLPVRDIKGGDVKGIGNGGGLVEPN